MRTRRSKNRLMGELIMELHGHFDGKVVILDEPAPHDWKPNQLVKIVLADPQESDDSNAVLLKIAARARDVGLPEDFSDQHDHYVHGTAKR